MIDKMAVWNQVQQGSKIKWRGRNGTLYDAKVVRFTTPESYIRVKNDADGTHCEIWIEEIEAVDNSQLGETQCP